MDDLAKKIAKLLSYDASEYRPEIKCQHCGKVARDAILSYWFDHRQSTASNIVSLLNVPTGLVESTREHIEEILEHDVEATGNATNDAKIIADMIENGGI